MTALTTNQKYQVRGGPQFGYGVAANTTIFAGAMVCLNAAGALQRPQDAGSVVFAGMADRYYQNSTGAATVPGSGYQSGFVVAQRDLVVQINVPSASYANIGATVYAVDDATLSLTDTGGTLLAVGTLEGIDQAGTWVRLVR